MAKVQKITPFLWFDNQAQEAAGYYVSIFDDSKIISESPLVTEFELCNQGFKALNGGPYFTFSEAISFFILCKDQKEVDYFWNTFISDGGTESQCGWLKDKFGLSWQIVPERFMSMVHNADEAGVQRLMEVIRPMKKLVIADMEKAFYN